MIRPTRRLLLLLLASMPLAVLPALCSHRLWPLWFLWFGATVLLLGLELLLAPGSATVQLEVDLPEVLFLGDPDPLQLRLCTTARAGMRVELLIDVGGNLQPLPLLVARCQAGAVTAIAVPLQPVRRGQVQVRRTWLRWTGPFGLLWREQRRHLGRTAKVLPNVRAVQAQALRCFASREFQTGLKVEQFIGDGSEFDALREYVPGFDRRAVDWKATARHRRLLCREYRAERNHQVILAIDCGHLMSEPLRGVPRVDHAIDAALLLGHICLKTGDLVGAFAFDDRPRLFRRPEAGLSALRGLQDALAGLDYGPAASNFTLALTDLLRRCRRRSLVVLFTDFVDAITAELLVPNVAHLARRHLVLFVALRDPALPALAGAEPASTTDLHRAVVAAELQREREVVLERIRRAGVQVIDAEVARIGPALINRYLELKRRELL
ncbi:MAG TPA: DUF58 domain-containing protein [Planctomycetota bacterium]|nr:DUF58 domain-containing protein [Planctomycetota bacterium]